MNTIFLPAKGHATKVKVDMTTQNVITTPEAWKENRDLATMLRILDEECRKCTPLTPLECISSCKTWKLKNELRRLRKIMENKDFERDLMNVLKNGTRLRILMTISKGDYSIGKLQQELKKTGHSYSQDTMFEEYLSPLIEVGLAVEAQNWYHATMFGNNLTKMIEGSANMLNILPVHSEYYEETVLQALLSGPKTFEDIKTLVSQKVVSRILRRLKTVELLETPKKRDYIFFFRSKRDPSKETLSSSESRVYNSLSNKEGISAGELAEKAGLTTRTTYKYLRGLKGKKLVFNRKTPKTYRLTAKGEKLASLLNKLHKLFEETLSSSEQVIKVDETIAS